LACKNSINRQIPENAGMLRVFGFHPLAELYILAGTVAGKREEILVEVRLIVVVSLVCYQPPID